MMDTQRLIAFVVFSFSALLLWDAWQKHNAPKIPPAPASATASVPGGPQPAAKLDAKTPSATVPGVPTATTTAPAGEAVTVKTDLYEIELNTAGGDIRRGTVLEVVPGAE